MGTGKQYESIEEIIFGNLVKQRQELMLLTCGAYVYLLRGREFPDGNVQGAEGAGPANTFNKIVHVNRK